MSKKLNRMIYPGMGIYFAAMLIFCFCALLADQLVLAALEFIATMTLALISSLSRKIRYREILRYIQSAPNTLESVSRGECPFPTVIARMGDGGIIWTNDQFVQITGFSDSMVEQTLADVLPNMKTDWLTAGKNEAPQDVTVRGRRFRVYGTTIKSEDPTGTVLGVF